MEITSKILGQVLIMFLIMGVGIYLVKRKILSDKGSKEICSLLLGVVTPFMIMQSYIRPFELLLLKNVLIAAVLAAAVNFGGILIVTLIFKEDPERKFSPLRMCAVFSNSGFMAFPIITAVLGSDALFVASAFIAVMNIFNWTYGVYLVTGDKKDMSLKKALINPATIGLTCGLLIFIFQIPIPIVATKAIGYVAGLNTPLAMIVMGSFVATSDIVGMLKEKSTYVVCFTRLILIPLIVVAGLALLPIDQDVLLIVLLCASCPTAVAASMFPAMFGGDYKTSSALIAITTLLSVVTLPAIVSISQMVWR